MGKVGHRVGVAVAVVWWRGKQRRQVIGRGPGEAEVEVHSLQRDQFGGEFVIVPGVENRVWTQVVFRHVAPPDVYADLTLFLLHWMYFFTRVEPEVVLAACRSGSWNPDDPILLRVVEWLGMPELAHLGAAQVCAFSLRLIWREGVEVRQKEGVVRALQRAVLGRHGGRRFSPWRIIWMQSLKETRLLEVSANWSFETYSRRR